jgi:hypothetical protein
VQAKQWPQNPLDDFIKEVQVRPRGHVAAVSLHVFSLMIVIVMMPQLLSDHVITRPQAHPAWVVADLGCGDARLRKRSTFIKKPTGFVF